jgi:hydroxypyruvate isomerase
MLYKDNSMSFEEYFKKAKAIGYEATEIHNRDGIPFDEIIGAARSAGLRIASMCGHFHLHDGLNKKENHNRIREELLASLEIAVRNNIPGLICFSGNRNEGQSDEAGQDVCAEGLSLVIKNAEQMGVNLNMELLNSKVDHPNYQCDHTAWGVGLCQKLNSPRFKLLYDIYHMQIMEGDIIRTILANIHHIGHFHTAGNPGRNDLDNSQEMNYRGICKAIAVSDYEYYLGHEFLPRGDRMKALEEAFKICDQSR